jgi:hypothetical protein
MFRFHKWSVDQKPNGIYALYENAPFSNHRTRRSFHNSFSAAIIELSSCFIADGASPDEIWMLWSSFGQVYDHAEKYDHART